MPVSLGKEVEIRNFGMFKRTTFRRHHDLEKVIVMYCRTPSPDVICSDIMVDTAL